MAAQVAAAAAGLLVNVLAARGMGPDGRGALAFYLQLAYVLSAVLLAGTDRALPAVRRNSFALRAAEGQMLRLLGPGVAVTVFVLLLGPVVAGFAGAEMGGILAAAAAAMALWGNTVLLALRAAAIAAEDTGRFLRVMVSGQAILVVGACGLLALSIESTTVWLCLYGGALLLPAAVALVLQRPDLHGNAADRRTTRRLGLRLAPTVIANMVMLRSDRLLLPVLADPAQLGLYVVVAGVTELISWPIQSFVDGRVPLWRRALDQGSLATSRVLGGAAVAAVVATVTVGHSISWLLVPVFGTQYESARPLIWPLAIASGLYAFSRFGAAITVAANRSSLATAIDVTGMLVSASAYVFLIPEHGASGAAVGSLLGYGVAAVASAGAVLRLSWPMSSHSGGASADGESFNLDPISSRKEGS
ncbi:lipopolysaccharide biosynthesis protein [Blastococcus aggregatus]|uniref:lipopolysaccharide biosynthesis protein n=1 Tax=Blastococcus aggregatus TaxID=38502 RepID=UPI0011424D41|nr:hypothetical protein [Blastococcus aggregatus]